ncbi:MAG TPA: hypothetical protein VFU37_09485 [Pyrinomonadaceae bacterium]|jgi:hypothetical protein|nr:hypothetical protein [Pyrinomonadaceae bacterium]
MKKIIRAIVMALGILFAVGLVLDAVVVMVGSVHPSTPDSPRNTPEVGDRIDDALLQAANKWNAAMPQQLNESSRIDTIKAGHRRLTFFYTVIVNDPSQTERRMNELKEQMANTAKTHPGAEVFRQNHVEFVYYFRDQNGNYLGLRSVMP